MAGCPGRGAGGRRNVGELGSSYKWLYGIVGDHTLNKLETKRVDLVVANHARDAFGRDDNRATLVTADTAEAFGVLPKPVLADRILELTGAVGNIPDVAPPSTSTSSQATPSAAMASAI